MLPTDEQIRAEAQRRFERDSLTHPNHRPLHPMGGYTHWLVGLMGEREFSKLFNVKMNMELLPSGDGHADFKLPFNCLDGVVREFVVDLKCNSFQGPWECMLVEEVELRRWTIYVCANHDVETVRTVIHGWMLGRDVATYPRRAMKGKKIINYCVPVDRLHVIGTLIDRSSRSIPGEIQPPEERMMLV